jgi:peptidoglycan/LPS O-acetylase OafA/YrhL
MSNEMPKRLRGLDGIRFCAALTVVIGHYGLPALSGPGAGGLSRLVDQGLRAAFNGPAAVIVFFVLSGLVIHYPMRISGGSPDRTYFVRRYVRILGPMIAALAAASWLGPPAPPLLGGVLWSLWAELIYYSVYPVLLPLGRRFGWGALAVGAFVPSLALSIFRGGNFVAGDARTDWIVGLPCWLLGCWVAERIGRRTVRSAEIWSWRVAVAGASVLLVVVNFHTRLLPFRYTLAPFSILVAPWLIREVARYNFGAGGDLRRPWNSLERAGAWSYSLYVVHVIAFVWLDLHPGLWRWVGANELAQWVVRLASVLVISYAFSRLVERPAQRLARWSAARIEGGRAAAQAAG